MASNGNKDPIGNLMDKLRSLLGFQERQNNTLPPKARFEHLDFATRHSSSTPAYSQQVGKWRAGIALSPGQISKISQYVG